MYHLQSVDEAERAEQLHQIRTLRRAVILAITALGLTLLLVVLLIISSNIRSEVGEIENELTTLQNRLVSLQTLPPEVQTVLDEVAALRERVTTIETAELPPNIHWPTIIRAVSAYDRQRILLESISQTDMRVTLSGMAVDNNAVLEYAQRLAATPQVASVEIQSIRAVPPPPETEAATEPEAGPQPADTGDAGNGTAGEPPRDAPTMTIEFVTVMILDAALDANLTANPDAAQQ